MSEEVIVGIVLAVVLGAIFVGIAVSEYKKKHRDCKKCGGKNSMSTEMMIKKKQHPINTSGVVFLFSSNQHHSCIS